MLSLIGKNMVVIGGSRGVGRRIVEAGIRNGAHVLAVARQESALRQLAQEVPGTEVLSLEKPCQSSKGSYVLANTRRQGRDRQSIGIGS